MAFLFSAPLCHINKKGNHISDSLLKRLAAAYFSTNMRSIIGDDGLNFSVRNGKRWTPSPKPPKYLRKRYAPATIGAEGIRGNTTTESSRVISTARLRASQPLHLRPIKVVVSDHPVWKSHLGAGFALRCFQRLSLPDIATRQCSWRHNRHTRGQSNPVLSY